MSSATWRASGRASVLMRMISSWIAGGWPTSCSCELGVAHHLGVVLQRVARPAAARPAGARCSHAAMFVNVNDSVASMIAPAKASPNDSPNEPAGRVHAGGLADPLLGDRARACSC